MKQFGVIGLGRFGKSVTETLYVLGHEVIVIDSEEENINEMADFASHTLIGDATQKAVLEAAGLSELDVVIVGITDFESSIMTCILCQELGVKKIIAKARSDQHAEILKKIGVQDAIIPEKDLGRKLANNLATKNVIESISLSANYEIVEFTVPHSWMGETIAQLDIRKKYGLSILGINRGENEFIGNPKPSTDLKTTDTLLILGSTEQLKALHDLE